MRTNAVLVAAGVGLLAAGAAFWWMQRGDAPVSGTIERGGATAPEPPPIRHPLEPAADESPPPLEESDAYARERVGGLWAGGLPAVVFEDRLVRRLVATVDALPRDGVPAELAAVKPVPGAFQVAGPEEAPVAAPENAARYDAYLQAFEAVEVTQAAAVYRRLYPLLQSAYEDLGYPGRYFNDRVVEVIDHLLATPEPAQPPRLARPHVLYTYADPDFEARSAGQKALLRLGAERAARVKTKLRDFRAAIASGARDPDAAPAPGSSSSPPAAG